MKAVVAHAFGPIEDLDYRDWPVPVPADHEVVVEAEAIGVNFPDGLMVQGKYQMKPQFPFVPGSEMVGRVVETGAAVTSVRRGDYVAALPLVGGFAERLAVDEKRVIPLPAALDSADACALLCGYGTAHHALKQRADLRPGETLCVLGASGLTGLAAIQIGKIMGATVIAVASTDDRRAVAAGAGADHVLGYNDLKANLKAVTGGRGVDVAFDPVGGDAFDALSRAMAWRGRLLVVGFASGTIPRYATNLALVKGYSLVGVIWGTFTEKEPETYRENMRELFAWHAAGRIRPVIDGIYGLSDAPAVLARIVARGAAGKVVLRPERPGSGA